MIKALNNSRFNEKNHSLRRSNDKFVEINSHPTDNLSV